MAQNPYNYPGQEEYQQEKVVYMEDPYASERPHENAPASAYQYGDQGYGVTAFQASDSPYDFSAKGTEKVQSRQKGQQFSEATQGQQQQLLYSQAKPNLPQDYKPQGKLFQSLADGGVSGDAAPVALQKERQKVAQQQMSQLQSDSPYMSLGEPRVAEKKKRRDLSESDRRKLSHEVIFHTSGHGLLTPEELKEFRHVRGQVGFTSMVGMALLPANIIVYINARKDANKMLKLYFFSTLLFAVTGASMMMFGYKQSTFLSKMSEKYLRGLSDQEIRTLSIKVNGPGKAEQKAVVAAQLRTRLPVGLLNGDNLEMMTNRQ